MTVKKIMTVLVVAALTTMLGCTTNAPGNAVESDSSSTAALSESSQKNSAEAQKDDSTLETTTYRTHLYERLGLPGPTITFEYPRNWQVTQEECNPQKFAEHVELTSDTGRVITFNFGNTMANTSGHTTETLRNIQFNSEIYPNLEIPKSAGEYMTLERTDEEIRNLKLEVRRWEREPQLGEGRGYYVTDATGRDPYYYGYFQFMCFGTASRGDIEFTSEEEADIVQILSSLRQEPAPYDAESAKEAAHILESLPGSYMSSKIDGNGRIIIEVWEISDNGTATNMVDMSNWDFTWSYTGKHDSLGRPIVSFEPLSDSNGSSPKELAFDEELNALCEPGDPNPAFTR